ncbi:response regulator transcription factor [Hellea balneolensis]|uniref:response regulator transcription factor n=1 Tax=Hellea balneolensis TaxID=287478 RepID=UPI00040403A9|nr:helix-turn-helix transcriptional regulator [Hellea balneolensis]
MDILRNDASLDDFGSWISSANSVEELRGYIETHLRCGAIAALAYTAWPEGPIGGGQLSEISQGHMKMHFGVSARSRHHIESQFELSYMRESLDPFWMVLKDESFAKSFGGFQTRKFHKAFIIPLAETKNLNGYMAFQFYENRVFTSHYKSSLIELSQMIHGAYADLAQAETELLTPQELDIIRWAALGKSDHKIAEIIGLTPQGLERHMKSIFKKLGVYDRIKAGLMAIALRLI